MALHKHLKCQHWLNDNRNYLFYAAILTVLFGAVEALCGWWYGSLTLLSDAGHMGIDALVLLLAALASWMARRPTTAKHTYGFGRIEVIVSWFSSLLLILLIITILTEAIKRLHIPHTIPGTPIIIVALIGLGIVNGGQNPRKYGAVF
jgi:cobalt-zinc-cadmium efflux system protein